MKINFSKIGTWLLIAIVLGVTITFGITSAMLPQNEINEKVITIAHELFAPEEVLAAADFTCDGTADDVQVQAAVDALPATGGKVQILGGTYNFDTTVTRAINSVMIEGVGSATYIDNDAATPLFTAGGNNWQFANLYTDNGGITMGATTGWTWQNVTINTSFYALRLSSELTADSVEASVGRDSTFLIAASDAPDHVISQADYICDGTADNVEIAAAIAALPADGGTIHFSTGTFNIAVAIGLPEKPVYLIGEGMDATTLKLVADISYMFSTATLTYGGMENLTLDGDTATRTSGTGFFGRTYQYLFKRVKFYAFDDCGIYFDGIDAGHDIESTIDKCIFWGNSDFGIRSDAIRPCSGVHISSTLFQSNYIDYYGRGQWWTFDDRCIFSGTTYSPSLHFLNDSYNCKVTNCRFQDCEYTLVYFQLDASTCENFEFSHNNIEECNKSGAGGQSVVQVIHTTGTMDYVNITDNIMRSTGVGNAFNTFINLSAGVDNIVITDNDIIGATITTKVAHSATTYVIKDNLGIVTENSGTATLLNANTSVTVAHGLDFTPTAVFITFAEDPTNALGDWWVDTIGAANFVLHGVDPGASNLDFYWKAIYE